RKQAPPRSFWLGAPRPDRRVGSRLDASPVWRRGALDLGTRAGDRLFAAGAPAPFSSYRGKPFFSGPGQRLDCFLGGGPATDHPGVAAARARGKDSAPVGALCSRR